jgi:hypothetical protein
MNKGLVLIALCAVGTSASSDNIAYVGRKINGAWYHAVVANLDSDHVKVSGLVNKTVGRAEPIWQMIGRSQPDVAISGTFFDTRSKRPIGTIVIEGENKVDGFHGSCLAVDHFNQAAILDPKWGRKFDMSLYRFVVRGGVRLLTDSELKLYPKAQKFKDPRVFSPARRIGVGVTKHNKIVFVGTDASVTLSGLAKAMKELGARDAIALDGGGSAAMYYRGKMLMKPNRGMTNLLTLSQAQNAAWKPLPLSSGGK